MKRDDLPLNIRLAAAEESATYRMMDRANSRKLAGRPVISLTAGEPDFDTPVHVCDAAIDAIRKGYTRYTPVAGARPLREAVAAKFKRENGLDVEWKDTIICSGGKQVIYNALAATLNDGDEVIVPSPYWVSYPEMVQICGGRSVIVPCPSSTGFKLTAEALAQAITPRTRWLILNSPSNPTGAVYSREELAALARTLLDHPQVFVLTDDIYEHLIFDGAVFHTIAQVEPRLRQRTLTMNGVSKAYAMTGWRIGFGTGPRWLIEAMEKLQGQQTSGACSISQHAAMAALNGNKDFTRHARERFERRRNLVVEMLNRAPGMRCEMPAGAFYAFASCEGLIGRRSPAGVLLESDEAVAMALLDEADVGTVHGAAFGLSPYLRIAYATDEDSLRRALESVRSFCSRTTGS
jgi:aspartate aminotransferase